VGPFVAPSDPGRPWHASSGVSLVVIFSRVIVYYFSRALNARPWAGGFQD
jgi:hypothetical protein